MSPGPRSPAARDLLAPAAVLAGAVACVAGLVAHGTLAQAPWARSAELAAIAGLVALIAWPLARWRRLPWASALAAVWCLLAGMFAGPIEAGAAVALALACVAAGSILAPHGPLAVAGVVGAGLLAGLVGWGLPLPVHHAFVYLPLLVALVAWRRLQVRTQLIEARAAWSAAVAAHPRAAAWAVIALGLASTSTWLPTLQHDDLAYHLGIPWQLAEHARYSLDPTHQVWALAPWLGDVLQGMAQAIAHSEARGAVNAAWLLAIASLAWRLSSLLGLDARGRWITLALLGTMPLLPALLEGMQTELPAAAVALALACLAFDRDAADKRTLLACGVLAGMLAGLKLMHPLAASALVAAAAWRLRDLFPRAPLRIASTLALAVLVGGSSYAYAWMVARNPVLPLFNATFRSPYFATVDFRDPRWTGDGLLTPWFLTFDTSRYGEGWDGGAGFLLVALGAAVLVALLDRRLRVAAACALVAIAVPLAVVPYARYAFVGLVLALPVAVAVATSGRARRAGTALLVGVAALDFLFVPNASWLLHTGAAKRAVLAAGREAPLMERYAPERLVAARIRRHHPHARVLDLHGASHAELAGRGRTATWYAPRLHAAAIAADRDPTGRAWVRLIAAEGITDLVFRPASVAPARAAALARLPADRAMTIGEVQWRRITAPDAR